MIMEEQWKYSEIFKNIKPLKLISLMKVFMEADSYQLKAKISLLFMIGISSM